MTHEYKVEVYSKPDCMPCKATKKALDAAGVFYIEYDVTANLEAAQMLRDLGYSGVPVVTIELPDGLDHWQGYKPSSLLAVAELAGTK